MKIYEKAPIPRGIGARRISDVLVDRNRYNIVRDRYELAIAARALLPYAKIILAPDDILEHNGVEYRIDPPDLSNTSLKIGDITISVNEDFRGIRHNVRTLDNVNTFSDVLSQYTDRRILEKMHESGSLNYDTDLRGPGRVEFYAGFRKYMTNSSFYDALIDDPAVLNTYMKENSSAYIMITVTGTVQAKIMGRMYEIDLPREDLSGKTLAIDSKLGLHILEGDLNVFDTDEDEDYTSDNYEFTSYIDRDLRSSYRGDIKSMFD